MAVTTTWSVQDMTHTNADGGVFQVIWQCLAQNPIGVDEEGDPVYGPERAVEAGKYVTTYDVSSVSHVAFADLTEAVVLQWVWDSEDFDKDAIEADRTSKVEAQIVNNAATSTGVPWATEVPEVPV